MNDANIAVNSCTSAVLVLETFFAVESFNKKHISN